MNRAAGGASHLSMPSIDLLLRALSRFALAAAVLSLGACATTSAPPTAAITEPPSGDLQLVEVMRDPARFSGSAVRWGGTVLSVAGDGEGAFRVEVVSREIAESGRPRIGGGSDGRFVIRAPTEDDANRYRRGDLITVAGTVLGETDGRIGDEPASFPLITVTDHYRWREDPYAYDPYWPGGWSFGLGVGRGSYYRHGRHYHRRFGGYGWRHRHWPHYGYW